VAIAIGTYALADFGLHIRRARVAAQIADPPQDDPRFLSDPVLRRVNRPGYTSMSASPTGQPRRYTINDQGFRGPPTLSPKPADGLRIVVVGGSTVYGALNDDSETLPVQLENALNERLGPRVEVINAGVPGYYSLSEAIVTRRDLLALSPDLIVDLDGLNDVFYGRNEEWPAQMAEDQLHLLHDGRFQDLVDVIDQTMFPRGLVEHQASMLVRDLRERFDLPGGGPSANERVVNLHAAALGKLASYAQSQGVPSLVALQPLLATGNKPVAPEEQAAVEAGGYWSAGSWANQAREMYPPMATTTRAAVERAGGRFLDLRGAFDAESAATYAEDAVHYTQLGNERLAEALATAVADILATR
jgi:lysophospholipase L1-like esterase